MSRRYPMLVALLVSLLTSCSPEDLTCPQPGEQYAVRVSFRHAVTGETLTGPTPGRVIEGSYTDSLVPSGFDGNHEVVAMAAALDRPGIYRLEAHRPGFEPYVATGLRAVRGSCGYVEPAGVFASLQPVE